MPPDYLHVGKGPAPDLGEYFPLPIHAAGRSLQQQSFWSPVQTQLAVSNKAPEKKLSWSGL